LKKGIGAFRVNLALALSGIQEAAVAIADHVNQHVQKTKLKLNAAELEQEIRGKQIALGKAIYRSQDAAFATSNDEPDFERLIKKTTTLRKRLEANNAIVFPYEALHDFERLLIRSDFIIQQVVIAGDYKGIGQSIKDLALPSQMLIFFIKKKNEVELAYGDVIIRAEDEVTFLCSKEAVKDYISFWK